MKVSLLSVTPDALTLLLRTKGTRLAHTDDPASWSDAQRAEHLSYMRDTIKSSWEFVDYVFSIEGVSRAFTHQLVRTRNASYAQESQRTIDASNNGWLRLNEDEYSIAAAARYDAACQSAFSAYSALNAEGFPPQDARGVLPTATLTNIIAKFNLRTLHDMAKTRLCTRTQGEYQDVFRSMRAAVIEIHPWVEEHGFLEVHCVAEGTCAFPRFGRKECKFYSAEMDLSALKDRTRALFWSSTKQVAVPVAKNGKTQ